MKKLTVFALVVIGALVLTACGPKVKETDAQKIAVEDAKQDYSSVQFTHTSMNTQNGVTTYEFAFGNDIGEWEYTLDGDGNITSSKETIYADQKAEPVAEDGDGFDPYYAELTEPGNLDINPDFDPFNAIKNLGVDQAGFISDIKDTDYYTFYDNDDYDLHVFWKGLSSTLTDSDTSFFQLFTDKGSTVPFRMIYVDVYEDKDEFCKEFDYLDSKLQEVYGTPVSAGYVNADGEDNPCTMEDLKEDLPGIDNSDGGYVYISYDSANPHVEINGQYDPEDQCYRTFVEFLQTE